MLESDIRNIKETEHSETHHADQPETSSSDGDPNISKSRHGHDQHSHHDNDNEPHEGRISMQPGTTKALKCVSVLMLFIMSLISPKAIYANEIIDPTQQEQYVGAIEQIDIAASAEIDADNVIRESIIPFGKSIGVYGETIATSGDICIEPEVIELETIAGINRIVIDVVGDLISEDISIPEVRI